MRGFKPYKGGGKREAPIDRKVREYAISRGCESIKLTTFAMMGTAGYPDRLYLLPGGRLLFMEMKGPGKPCTERQLESHKRLRALGFTVFVVDDVAAGRQIIDDELARGRA